MIFEVLSVETDDDPQLVMTLKMWIHLAIKHCFQGSEWNIVPEFADYT